jgi:hypothetical protein
MKSAIRALLAVLCLGLASTAHAQTDPIVPPTDTTPPPTPYSDVVQVYAGANGIWFDGPDGPPGDLELGGAARASLSPHMSLVGGGFYGVNHSYFRGSAGLRLTVSDVDNPNFSVGVGLQYQASTKPSIRPQEWAPDVSIGWRPWPSLDRVTVGAQASYGMDSNRAYLIAAIRYRLDLF